MKNGVFVSMSARERVKFSRLVRRLDLDEGEAARRLFVAAVRAYDGERWIDWPLRLQPARE